MKHRFVRHLFSKPMDISETVEDAVYMESYDRGGELEQMRAAVSHQTKILGFMASKLSADDQRDLAYMLGYKDF